MNKKVCILFGSPRKNGNTANLLIPFIDELNKAGADITKIDLYDKKIEGCIACRTCQNIFIRMLIQPSDSLFMLITSPFDNQDKFGG